MAKRNAQWLDVTSYSQGEARVPRTWQRRTPNLRLVVTRLLHHEGWWLQVRDLGIDGVALGNAEIEAALTEAMSIVREHLGRLVQECAEG
mgnify:CR=1 FL=1